jgi:hypothetical protein
MPYNNNLAQTAGAEHEHPRRRAIKQMAGLLGIALSAQSLDLLAASDPAARKVATKLLSADELQMTAEIAELIIPATDTPGALAVNVHGFIDQYLAECVSKYEQDQFKAGLKKINTIAEDKFHKTFLACTHKQQQQLLTALEKLDMGFTQDDKNFFRQMKSYTLFGYYTSEAGASQELAFLPVPGGYQGNFPFAKIGKAWSLN